MEQIKVYIVATVRGSATSHLSIVRLIDSTNREWKVIEAVIAHQQGTHRFFTLNERYQSVPVLPHRNISGTVYWMQSVSNGEPSDNLLSLPFRNTYAA